MAKKQRPGYLCRECGYRSAKWLGRCPQCEAWDSFEVESAPPAGVKTLLGEARRARVEPAAVRSLDLVEDDGVDRRTSAAPLIDRVLGGGVVPGGAVLLAGEPGIGKSTLLLQLGHALAGSGSGSAPEAAEDPPVLYVSAEESPRQLRLRAQRLGCLGSGLAVAGETEIEPILATVEARKPPVLLVDSVQALRAADLTGPPGSVSQVRHCAEQLVTVCKAFEIALFLVGHVTKDGAIAGPKSLEHLVDTVITFEGEGATGHRILRAQKNRFGPTGEVAMFEMRDAGLVPVIDPSKVLLARRQQHRPGSAVLASLHGSRPLLVEVQALVHPSPIPTPRRQAQGLDGTRATLLTAVLERFAALGLADQDLFLNVVGGLAVKEPAADLAAAAAMLSAARDRPLREGTVFFGEIGLLGEVRPVAQSGARLREVQQLGFERAVCSTIDPGDRPDGLEILEVEDVGHLAEHCF